MRFEAFSFGSICIDGTTYEYDLVIDRGRIRKRKKKPSKRFRDRFGHTPLSIEEEIPWKCRRLVIGTGTGALGRSHDHDLPRPYSSSEVIHRAGGAKAFFSFRAFESLRSGAS
jgi:hypothetical protein